MADTATTKLRVNGQDVTLTAPGDRSLLEILREDLALTGTKYGCGEGACGACSLLVDGKRMFSCSTRAIRVAGRSVTTIEGLALAGANGAANSIDGGGASGGAAAALHPVQQAFLDAGAFQCGYCTPGMIIATVALLERNPNPSHDEVRQGMDGNICRCWGYDDLRVAVKRAAELARK